MQRILPISFIVVVLAGAVAACAIWGYSEFACEEGVVESAGTTDMVAALRSPVLPAAPLSDDALTVTYDWSLWDLDGREIPFGAFKGKVVFLNFWATWCVPCVAEMPGIQALKRELGSDDVIFVLAAKQSAEELRGFVAQHPSRLPLYRAPELPTGFQVDQFPTTFIIAPDGRVALRETGAANWNTSEVAAFIADLLQE